MERSHQQQDRYSKRYLQQASRSCRHEHHVHHHHHQRIGASTTRKTNGQSAARRPNDDLSSIRVDFRQDDPSDMDNFSVSHGSHAFLEAFAEHDIEDDAVSRSSSSHSSSSHHSRHSHDSTVGVRRIAHQETKNVSRWKTCVMLLLLVNAVLVTVATYEFLKKEEESYFEAAVRINVV